MHSYPLRFFKDIAIVALVGPAPARRRLWNGYAYERLKRTIFPPRPP